MNEIVVAVDDHSHTTDTLIWTVQLARIGHVPLRVVSVIDLSWVAAPHPRVGSKDSGPNCTVDPSAGWARW